MNEVKNERKGVMYEARDALPTGDNGVAKLLSVMENKQIIGCPVKHTHTK